METGSELSLSTLLGRRAVTDLKFIYRVLHGHAGLVEAIRLIVPEYIFRSTDQSVWSYFGVCDPVLRRASIVKRLHSLEFSTTIKASF